MKKLVPFVLALALPACGVPVHEAASDSSPDDAASDSSPDDAGRVAQWEALQPFLNDPYWYCTVDWWCHDPADMDLGAEFGSGATQEAACMRAQSAARNAWGRFCRTTREGAGINPCICTEETVLSALLAESSSRPQELQPDSN